MSSFCLYCLSLETRLSLRYSRRHGLVSNRPGFVLDMLHSRRRDRQMPAATLLGITLSQFQTHFVYVSGSSPGSKASSVLYSEDAWFQSRPRPGYTEFSRDFGDSIQRTTNMVPGKREQPRQSMYYYFQHSSIVVPFGTTYCELLTQPSDERTREAIYIQRKNVARSRNIFTFSATLTA